MITGKERFTFENLDLRYSVLDFWQFAYSELNSDPRDDIAEFLVSKALGVNEAYNKKNWTAFDILYHRIRENMSCEYRIEVKCTGYYQTWRTDGKVAQNRIFSIRKSQDENGVVARHNDIYVFCLLNGETLYAFMPSLYRSMRAALSADVLQLNCASASVIRIYKAYY